MKIIAEEQEEQDRVNRDSWKMEVKSWRERFKINDTIADLEEVQEDLINLSNSKTIADPSGRPPFEVEYAIRRLDVVIDKLNG